MAASEHTPEMAQLYQAGHSLADIGKRFGFSRQRVHQLIGDTYEKPHGGRLRREAYDQNIRSAHARILEAVSTVDEEAEKLGIQPHSLRAAFSIRQLRIPRKTVPLHGSYYRYQSGCRCSECKAAVKAYRQTLIERGPPHHGTVSAYRNYACRCGLCRAAGARANRRDLEKRKERKRQAVPLD